MEHEEYTLMMMDALDGELAAEQRQLLESHLRACPPCEREWQALTAIDALFRQTPMLAPAADFAQRTLARLPNRRYRAWLIGAIYAVLLFSGVLPLLFGTWAVRRYGAVINEPGVLRSLLQSLAHTLEVIGTVVSALFGAMGQFISENPIIFGWLFVMVGFVVVWSGVYRQLLGIPNLSPARSVSR
ncbi:MAG: zf-HC2 domain-containing protein [Ardenticatenaceae bacterium]|nr:zf-HC2 domain-containing protein [Ardenticatenaceae bacterium]